MHAANEGVFDWVVAVGVPLAIALIGLLIKTNSKQHKNGQAAQDQRQEDLLNAIGAVQASVDKVDDRLDKHIEWHMGVPPTKKGAA